jgi:hypothetical protein
MAHPAANYFNELRQVSGVGVPETSGYLALRSLLNAVGDSLKPKIIAVIHPKDTGGNLPDGALFSAKELQKHGQSSPTLLKLKPERGVIEVKSLAEDITGLEQTQQVRNYLEHYNQIHDQRDGYDEEWTEVDAGIHVCTRLRSGHGSGSSQYLVLLLGGVVRVRLPLMFPSNAVMIIS